MNPLPPLRRLRNGGAGKNSRKAESKEAMKESMQKKIEALVEKAFEGSREKRSMEYKHGVFAGIAVHLDNEKAEVFCMCYPIGSASRDAFYFGLEEGYGIGKATR